MSAFWQVVYLLLLLFFLLLLARVVLSLVQAFAQDYRPTGVMLVVFETVYTITDPPLRPLQRLIPPLRLGQVQLDLAFTVLFLAVWIGMGVAGNLAR
jgi:YggT family protein